MRSEGTGMANRPIIFVTGISSFVGSNLTKALIDNGYRVKGLTRRPRNIEKLDSLEIIEGGFEDVNEWEKHLKDVDCLVNVAGEYNNSAMVQSVNFDGPFTLLDSCKRMSVKRWIQLSSVGAYGAIQTGIVDESYPDNPIGNYENSKSEFDKVLLRCAAKKEIDVTIIRPSIVYGVGMKNKSLHELIFMVSKNLFFYVGPKTATANYVHVFDVVHALLLCLRWDISRNKIYIVSNCGRISDLIESAANAIEKQPPARNLNSKLAMCIALIFGNLPKFPLSASRVKAFNKGVVYSTEKIEKELAWNPKYSLSVGIYDYTRYLRNKGII